MSDRNKPSPIPASDTQAVENQMRRALGLQGPGRPVQQQRPDQARARHKFVQDGGVPVVVLNRSEDPTTPFKARISELEASLEAEKAAHAATRRILHEAQLSAQAAISWLRSVRPGKPQKPPGCKLSSVWQRPKPSMSGTSPRQSPPPSGRSSQSNGGCRITRRRTIETERRR